MAEISELIGSSLEQLTREFNIITHNLANVSTAGYKRRCNSFSKSLAAQQGTVDIEGFGEADLITKFDFTQGSPIETGRSLDFALCGKGFFEIETPDGPLYSRNGTFHLNQNGQIVDLLGRTVAGQSGPITIPPDAGSNINVSRDGNITANGASVGKFKLVDFKDKEDELVAVGGNSFQAPEGVTAQAADNLTVKQAYQEGSNVKMIEELVDMIIVSRLYEANVRFLSVNRESSESLLDLAMG